MLFDVFKRKRTVIKQPQNSCFHITKHKRNKLKKMKILAVTLMVITFSLQAAMAVEDEEKTEVNDQVVRNRVVTVLRAPADPVLYRSEKGALPKHLTIRNAEVRAGSGNMAYITVKQAWSNNGEARITLKATLMIDGKKEPLSAKQQGENVMLLIPKAQERVELRTDAPAEVEVPVNYQGDLQIILQVED